MLVAGDAGWDEGPPGLQPRRRAAPELVALPADDARRRRRRALRPRQRPAGRAQRTGHNAEPLGALERRHPASRPTRLQGVEIDAERRVARVARRRQVGGRRAARLRARPGGAARLDAGRQRRRLLARRRRRLVRAQARPRREQRARDRARDRRRRAAPRRPRQRPGALLGAARRRRQLRRRHGARDRAATRSRRSTPASCSSRGSAAARCCTRGASWTADGARRGDLGRPDPPVPADRRRCRSRCAAQTFAIVEAVFIGSEADGAGCSSRCARSAPAIDTFAMVPPVGIAELHMDPPEPGPRTPATAQLLGELDAAAIDALRRGRRARAPARRSSRSRSGTSAARSRARRRATARSATLDGEFITFGVGMVLDEESQPRGRATARRASSEALAPYDTGPPVPQLHRAGDRPAVFYAPETCGRLRAVKAEVDPDGSSGRTTRSTRRLDQRRACHASGMRLFLASRDLGPDAARVLEIVDRGTESR